MKCAVIGAGAWGTAIATVLAHNKYTVMMWAREPEVVADIMQHHKNDRYLSGIQLDPAIQATDDLQQAVQGAVWIFEAVPVKYLRQTLALIDHKLCREATWVVTSKGIEQDTLALPSQIIAQTIGDHAVITVMAGPSFAHDLAIQTPTGLTIAADRCDQAQALQALLANSYVWSCIQLDMIGVQLGGALKNVITIGIGMLDGAGYADNAKALMFTRGLHEMVCIGQALGAKQESLYGLSGVGDLVLTSMGARSRNLEVGRRLGAGQSLPSILQQTGYIPEGINTVRSVYALAEKHGLTLPVCQGLHQVIEGKQSLTAMVQAVMACPGVLEYCQQ